MDDKYIKKILPQRIKPGTSLYNTWRQKLFDDCRTSQFRACKWALDRVPRIIKATGGMARWSRLDEAERKEIFGAAWAQYPLYAAQCFRDFEASAVDIGSIYSGSSEERTRWKIYLKTTWVEIADATYTFRVRASKVSDDIRKKPVFELWRSIPISDAIEGLNLGPAENVPGRDSGPIDANLRNVPNAMPIQHANLCEDEF
jgi:hypothetical protein